MIDALQDYWTPYQKRLIADDSERIAVLKSRRIGITEAASFKAIIKAISTPNHDVHVVSQSFREAKEIIRTACKWVDILDQLGLPTCDADTYRTKIEFSNRSRVIALPAKGVRSRGGTVIMDEAAFIKDCADVYKGVSPAVKSDAEGQLIVISTPLGKSGLFYDICQGRHGSLDEKWSFYRIDLHDAIEDGAHWLPEPAEIREEEPEDVYRQEYLCEFLGEKDQYFSYELLINSKIDPHDLPDNAETVVAGIDLGSTQDQTVLVQMIEHEDTRYISDVRTIKEAGTEKRLKAQQAEISDLLEAVEHDRIAVDANGLGKQLAENLQDNFGSVTSWGPSEWTDRPGDLVPKIRQDLEDGDLHLVDDPDLRKAFASIGRKERADRSLAFEADRDGDGHADTFYASLLAYGEYEGGLDFAFVM